MNKPQESMAPVEWEGTLEEHSSAWLKRSKGPGLLLALQLSALATFAVWLVLVPFMLLDIGCTALMTDSAHWLTEVTQQAKSPGGWAPILLVGLIPGLALGYYAGLKSAVSRFRFCAKERTLKLTLARAFGHDIESSSPFESIVSVRALYMSSYTAKGAFQLTLSNGAELEWLILGSDIPSSELEAHLAWLKTHAGIVIEPELRLDT